MSASKIALRALLENGGEGAFPQLKFDLLSYEFYRAMQGNMANGNVISTEKQLSFLVGKRLRLYSVYEITERGRAQIEAGIKHKNVKISLTQKQVEYLEGIGYKTSGAGIRAILDAVMHDHPNPKIRELNHHESNQVDNVRAFPTRKLQPVEPCRPLQRVC